MDQPPLDLDRALVDKLGQELADVLAASTLQPSRELAYAMHAMSAVMWRELSPAPSDADERATQAQAIADSLRAGKGAAP